MPRNGRLSRPEHQTFDHGDSLRERHPEDLAHETETTKPPSFIETRRASRRDVGRADQTSRTETAGSKVNLPLPVPSRGPV